LALRWLACVAGLLTNVLAAHPEAALCNGSACAIVTEETFLETRRRLGTVDSLVLSECVPPTPPGAGLFDVLYVVHSKDLGPLKWGMRSLFCRVPDIGKVWVVSDDAPAVRALLSELGSELGGDRISWVNEKDFPLGWHDINQAMNCKSNCGWYLQQLLKLYAGRTIPGIRDYMVVDADLVWFGKNVNMVAARDSKSGAPTAYFYNTAGQNRAPYFEHIARLTGGEVVRVDRAVSGITHHMVFKRDVLEALLKLCERHAPNGGPFWSAVLQAVDPKLENSVSEYELYLNYALKFHPFTVQLRHLTFANGPKPGVVYNGGDEGKTSTAVWVAEAHAFEKQMVLDRRTGFDYVGYHYYARKRYYDVSISAVPLYCALGVAARNSDFKKKCAAMHRRRLSDVKLTPSKSADPHILTNCTRSVPVLEGLFDVLYVVHSKDLGPLKWGMRSLLCRIPGIGKVWVVSDDAKSVEALLDELRGEYGKSRIGWFNEQDYPFGWHDVDQAMNCKSNCGWYLQQLLKLYAGRVIPGIRDYMVVDADLVWFGKNIKMVAALNAVGHPSAYYCNIASQNHRAYFDHINTLTGDQVKRVNSKISGVTHHMVFKLDVLEALFEMCEKYAGGLIFWKALLKSINPKAYNSVSEYELYMNYALMFHPETIKLRHLTFANGPRPGLISNGGDEASMRGTWGPVAHGFEKQMAIDQKTGYDYVGYHSYAKRRYYDVPQEYVRAYCEMGIRGDKNSDMEKPCRALLGPLGMVQRRRLRFTVSQSNYGSS
jgi:hypothetical protein